MAFSNLGAQFIWRVAHLDYPLKKPQSSEIALRDSLEPLLKNSEPTLPVGAAKDTFEEAEGAEIEGEKTEGSEA
jgi:hypothetical protein